MRFSDHLQEGVFLERPNRFMAWVQVNGAPVMAHVPNSGRMRELLWLGSRVLLTPRTGDGRKTAYDLSLVELGDTLVSSDARLPSALVAEAFATGQLHQFSHYTWLRREVSFFDSRLDILLGNGGLCYIEVKSVTLVEDGIGLFPDAPTSRGARHVEALAKAIGEGHRAAVVFVVQREDVNAFTTNNEADPRFSDALRKALAVGVEAYAYSCRVSSEEIVISEPVPVCL